jgi:EAL domain-containing protein (putative c-di-GMP-specific phosphodiesterase class I)
LKKSKAMDLEANWNDPVAHLRQALVEDAFTLYCQPIGVLGATMSYPMAEVLVRLREEEKALRPPGEFLPVLEHYGMMPELDRWVVRQVLRRLSLGCRIPCLTVNLSAQTLADRSFPMFFAEELLSTGVPGECVLFEIEESDAVAVPDCMSRFAATIGSLGSGVIIEGFGRHAECLEPLTAPCVSFVKLHGSLTRSLIADVPPSGDISQLLQVTAEIGIDVIADCVEEMHSLKRLKALKLRYVQGFGIYEPHPIESFMEPQTLQAA